MDYSFKKAFNNFLMNYIYYKMKNILKGIVMKQFCVTFLTSALFSTIIIASNTVKVENTDLDPNDCSLAYSHNAGEKGVLNIPAPGSSVDMDFAGSRNIAVTCRTLDDGSPVVSRCNVPKTGPFGKMTMRAASDAYSKFVECEGIAG